MREDYHIYYENEEELSVWQPEIKMYWQIERKGDKKYALYNDISRKKCNL